jgi:cell division protein FtsW
VQHQDSLYYATRQLAWAALAIVAMLLVKRVNYRQIYGAAWAYPAFGIATALVFAAYLVGDRYHRSIRLAGVGIQPSELAKPALILFLAYFLTRKAGRLNEWRTLAPLGLALAVLAAAVMKADLGTGW